MKRIIFSIVAVLSIVVLPANEQTANAQRSVFQQNGPIRSAISVTGAVRQMLQPGPAQAVQPQCASQHHAPQPQYVPLPQHVPQPQYVTQPQHVPQPQYLPYVHAGPVGYSTPTPAAPISAAKTKAKQLAAIAKQQFRSKQYGNAILTIDEIVKLAPKDSSGYQFRGLVSFTAGDFEAAAADAYDTLRLGNTWTRKSVDNLYANNAADYMAQLSNLIEDVAQKPSMPGHFLLAYHYMVNEQFENGKAELQNVLKIQPDEPLSKKLLVVLNQRLAQR